jgi:NCS2 family nucleobase:cation symporter-2
MAVVTSAESIGDIAGTVMSGAVVIMFGLIAAAGMKMLSDIRFNKRNMLIIGVSMAVALGLRGTKRCMQAFLMEPGRYLIPA